MVVGELAPDKDAGWGLIYRLNNLWQKVHDAVLSADYDEWNTVLDLIFSNLDYDAKYEAIEKDGKMVDVNIGSDDYDIYKVLSRRVYVSKIRYIRAKGPRHKAIFRSKWYQEMLKKDRWIRKFMMKLKLYITHSENSPGTALFGK